MKAANLGCALLAVAAAKCLLFEKVRKKHTKTKQNYLIIHYDPWPALSDSFVFDGGLQGDTTFVQVAS